MPKGWKLPLTLVAAAFVLASAVRLSRADEVLFLNGDRLTGTVKQVEAGKLTITTEVAGDVTVELAKVKTFSTTQPVSVRLRNGEVFRQTGISGGEGALTLQRPSDSTAVGATPVAVARPTTVPTADVVRAVAGPPVTWSGAVTVAGLLTQGNTRTESLNAAANVVRRAEHDRITLDGAYLYGADESPDTGEKTTTADAWTAAGKYDYFFTHRFYAYASTRVERDRVADLDLRLTPAVGVGYQWVETPKLNFLTETGVAWVYEEYENVPGSEDHFAARFAYQLVAALNDKVSVFHRLEYLPSVEDLSDFNLSADAGLRAALTAKMFTEFKLELRYDETPAPGAEHTDLRYILGVGWQF